MGGVPFQCEFIILSNYVSAKIIAYNGQLSLRPLLASRSNKGHSLLASAILYTYCNFHQRCKADFLRSVNFFIV